MFWQRKWRVKTTWSTTDGNYRNVVFRYSKSIRSLELKLYRCGVYGGVEYSQSEEEKPGPMIWTLMLYFSIYSSVKHSILQENIIIFHLVNLKWSQNLFRILPGRFVYLEALRKEEDGLFFTIISHIILPYIFTII